MRTRFTAILSYVGAGLTLAVAACVPFYLIGAFTSIVAHAGLHVEATYTGGTVRQTIAREGYQILVYEPVRPRALQRVEPFVQIAFQPAAALPSRISDEIDLDGDGQPDVRVTFTLPQDPKALLQGDVVALNGKYLSLTNVGGNSFSRLLVRAGDGIIVRVPLNRNP